MPVGAGSVDSSGEEPVVMLWRDGGHWVECVFVCVIDREDCIQATSVCLCVCVCCGWGWLSVDGVFAFVWSSVDARK